MSKLSTMRSGLNLMVISLIFWGIGIIGTAFSYAGNWSLGALPAIATVCLWAYPVLSLLGKGICCATPAYKDLVHTSLFFEVLALLLAFTSMGGGFKLICSFCAVAIFLSFVSKMGAFIEEPRASEAAADTGKYFGIALLGIPLCIVLAFINVKLILLGLLHFIIFLVLALLFYGRSLVLLRNALATPSTPEHGF